MAGAYVDLDVDGRTVRGSNPDKVFFPERGETKLDLVQYYLAVGEGALRGVKTRPTVMKRYPNGATGEFFSRSVCPTAGRNGWRRSPSSSPVDGPLSSCAPSTSPTSRGP